MLAVVPALTPLLPRLAPILAALLARPRSAFLPALTALCLAFLAPVLTQLLTQRTRAAADDPLSRVAITRAMVLLSVIRGRGYHQPLFSVAR